MPPPWYYPPLLSPQFLIVWNLVCLLSFLYPPAYDRLPITTTSRRPKPNQFVIDATFHYSHHIHYTALISLTWRPISSMFSICCINVYIPLLSDVEIYQTSHCNSMYIYFVDCFMRDRLSVIPANRNLWHRSHRMVSSRREPPSRYRGKKEPAV